MYSNEAPGTVRSRSEYTYHDIVDMDVLELGAISMPVFAGNEAAALGEEESDAPVLGRGQRRKIVARRYQDPACQNGLYNFSSLSRALDKLALDDGIRNICVLPTHLGSPSKNDLDPALRIDVSHTCFGLQLLDPFCDATACKLDLAAT
ncbi:hypothetical protein B0H14DRAFT_3428235 [Mycena olivaceomarginata]|nr:hypothetical protein B0H14DRAFT_3428235 [Mycena olivaceomarginata]